MALWKEQTIRLALQRNDVGRRLLLSVHQRHDVRSHRFHDALVFIAVLEPITVGGVVVSNATLHNEDEIARKDVREGDWVFLRRAGDVIPEIVKVIEARRTGSEQPFAMPKKCPVCGSDVFREEGGAIARCTGVSCPAQLVGRLRHFASRTDCSCSAVASISAGTLMKCSASAFAVASPTWGMPKA